MIFAETTSHEFCLIVTRDYVCTCKLLQCCELQFAEVEQVETFPPLINILSI